MSTVADDEPSRQALQGSPLNHPLFTIQNLLITRELALLYGNLPFFNAVNSDIQALLARTHGAVPLSQAAPAAWPDGEPHRGNEPATVH